MTIEGRIIRCNKFDKGFSAMLLLTEDWIVPAITHDNVQEGEDVQLEGSYRLRDGFVEFFAESVNKVLI